MKWIIYELRIWNQLWSSQLWTQFLQLRKEAWKFQDFKGVWTRDLAIPVRLSWFRTGIARSRVQTPLKSWNFQASLRNCKNCVHNCEDDSFTWLDSFCSPYVSSNAWANAKISSTEEVLSQYFNWSKRSLRSLSTLRFISSIILNSNELTRRHMSNAMKNKPAKFARATKRTLE